MELFNMFKRKQEEKQDIKRLSKDFRRCNGKLQVLLWKTRDYHYWSELVPDKWIPLENWVRSISNEDAIAAQVLNAELDKETEREVVGIWKRVKAKENKKMREREMKISNLKKRAGVK